MVYVVLMLILFQKLNDTGIKTLADAGIAIGMMPEIGISKNTNLNIGIDFGLVCLLILVLLQILVVISTIQEICIYEQHWHCMSMVQWYHADINTTQYPVSVLVLIPIPTHICM